MFFLLSGEGVTDMGSGNATTTICEGKDYFVGPMAIIVAKVVEAQHDYSIRDVASFLRLPGKKLHEGNSLFLQQRTNPYSLCQGANHKRRS